MIFFFFSFLATLFGSITAGSLINIPLITPSLNVPGPLSEVISFWPFIITFSLLLLAVLWFQTIKNSRKRKKEQSNRRTKQSGMPVLVLAVATVFVILLAFTPYFINSYVDRIDEKMVISEENRVETTLTVYGMTCTGCENTVNTKVAAIDGVESVTSSHIEEKVTIVYDKSRVTSEMISQTIVGSGYKVNAD